MSGWRMPTLGLAAYEGLSSQEPMALTKRESELKLCLSVERHCLNNSEILLVKGSMMPAKALMSCSVPHQSIKPKPLPLCPYQTKLLSHLKTCNSFKCMRLLYWTLPYLIKLWFAPNIPSYFAHVCFWPVSFQSSIWFGKEILCSMALEG